MNPEDVETKIKEYEQFLEETLKKDLKEIERILEEKAAKCREWEEVKQVVKTVKEFKTKDRDMLVRVAVGRDVMSTAEITDFNRIYVCIGLGYLLEMDNDEADKYSDIRLKLLHREMEHFRNKAVNVKVNIKMVLLAINELQISLLPPNQRTR